MDAALPLIIAMLIARVKIVGLLLVVSCVRQSPSQMLEEHACGWTPGSSCLEGYRLEVV